MTELLELTDRQLLEHLNANIQQQNALLVRMVQALERIADDKGDTQRLDVDEIRRELRTAVIVGERGK